MKGRELFIGVSQPNIVSKEMVRSMAKDPIVFAMANPNPEIRYDLAKETRGDVIIYGMPTLPIEVRADEVRE